MSRTLPDGSEYSGEIKNGYSHGFGFHTDPKGNKTEGYFKNGLPDGNGKWVSIEGITY